MDIDDLAHPKRTTRQTTPEEQDAAILQRFKEECDRVGVPYDPAGLVRHHRGNAGLIVGTRMLSLELLLKRAVTLLHAAEVSNTYGAPEEWTADRARFFQQSEELLNP